MSDQRESGGPSEKSQLPLCNFSASELLLESNRLLTFKNWPNSNISPQSLAKAGFFYLNKSDEVKCAWCKGVIAKWEQQDNAFVEHQRFFPDCPRVQLGPLIEIASDGIRDLGIQQVTAPKKPKFCSLDARMRTYDNWPINEIQRPESLAQAGLYYQNIDDQVRCFHCNIGLRSWQKEDDAFVEHAKWSPECEFVRLVKGNAYIQQVQEATREQCAQQQQLNISAPPSLPVMNLEDAMNTHAVVQALMIGIDVGAVRVATQRQLSQTGRPHETVEDLIKAVFDEREEETSSAAMPQQQPHASTTTAAMAQCNISNMHLNSDISGSSSCSNNNNNAILAMESPSTSSREPSQFTPPAAYTAPSTSSSTATIVSTDCPTATAACPIVIPPSNAKTLQNEPQTLSLEEENRNLKDARLCKVCLDDEVCIVFLPCGHLVTCVQCATTVQHCPMCRAVIKGFVRTYLS